MELLEVIEKLDLTGFKENVRSFIFDCPVCQSKQKLYIDKTKKIAICFRQKTQDCPSPKRHLAYTLSLLSGKPEQEIKFLLNPNKAPWQFSSHESFQSIFEPIPDIDLWPNRNKHTPPSTPQPPLNHIPIQDIPDHFYPLTDASACKDGIAYLEKRGLDISTLYKYDIRYSPIYKRVVFPVIMNGKWVGYQGRTILPDVQPRMYNLPGPWKAQSLMFYDNVKPNDAIIVAEGAVSALKFEKVGGFVATMGKTFSNAQVQLIKEKAPKTIYIAFDMDAYVEVDSLATQLYRILPDAKIYFLPTPKGREDFGDCTYDECEHVVKSGKIDITNNTLPIYEVIYEF